ncbi:MAG: hypothetical protein NVSMB2_18140 [Chloroflexota bacterium]
MIERSPSPTSGSVTVRPAGATDTARIQAIWDGSFELDDPSGVARGGWSWAGWASETRVLEVDGRPVGAAAIRAERANDGATPLRIALAEPARSRSIVAALVEAGVDLARQSGGTRARLLLPADAAWAISAVEDRGFVPVRTMADMLLPATTEVPAPREIPGLTIRPMRRGEDAAILATLNRNWAGTWNFVPITADMLAVDLSGQRDGMLLGVDADGTILATCHGVFEPTDNNVDGEPRAWISNVTVDPECRGRGVARAILLAGVAHLRERGATSIGLGVDADNPAPFHLYTSVGFTVVSQTRAWDLTLDSTCG